MREGLPKVTQYDPNKDSGKYGALIGIVQHAEAQQKRAEAYASLREHRYFNKSLLLYVCVPAHSI